MNEYHPKNEVSTTLIHREGGKTLTATCTNIEDYDEMCLYLTGMLAAIGFEGLHVTRKE